MGASDQSKARIEERMALEKKEQSMRMGASDWKTLKRELIHRYGTITAAWRHGLDFSSTGKVSFIEFCKACRNMGVQTDVRKIFRELDEDDSGIITFNEID